jgi:hypothetical protein
MARSRDVVQAAITENGAVLQYATTKMQGDKEIVSMAVEHHPLALQYASMKLRGDWSFHATGTPTHQTLDIPCPDAGVTGISARGKQ